MSVGQPVFKKGLGLDELLAQAAEREAEEKAASQKKEKKKKPKTKKPKEKKGNKTPKASKDKSKSEKKKKPKKRRKGGPRAFGRFLEPDDEIPQVLIDIVQALESGGMDTEGLFRVTASHAAIDEIVQEYEANGSVDFEAINDAHLIGGVFMEYFLKMPEPLIPFDNYDSFLAAGENKNIRYAVETIKKLITLLPPSNQKLLEYLFDFLDTMTYDSDESKMSSDNLAICFGPAIMRREEETIQQLMIESQIVNDLFTRMIDYYGFLYRNEPFKEIDKDDQENEFQKKKLDFAELERIIEESILPKIEDVVEKITGLISDMDWDNLWEEDNLTNVLMFTDFINKMTEKKKIPVPKATIEADTDLNFMDFKDIITGKGIKESCKDIKETLICQKSDLIDFSSILDSQRKSPVEDDVVPGAIYAHNLLTLLKYYNGLMAKKESSSAIIDVSSLKNDVQTLKGHLRGIKKDLDTTTDVKNALSISKLIRSIQKALKTKTREPIANPIRRIICDPPHKLTKQRRRKIESVQDVLEFTFIEIEKLLTQMLDDFDDDSKKGELERNATLVTQTLSIVEGFLNPSSSGASNNNNKKAANGKPPTPVHPKAANKGGPPPMAPHPKANKGGPPPMAPHPKAKSGGPPPMAPHPKAKSGGPPPMAPHPKANSGGPPPMAPHPKANSGGPPPMAPHPKANKNANRKKFIGNR